METPFWELGFLTDEGKLILKRVHSMFPEFDISVWWNISLWLRWLPPLSPWIVILNPLAYDRLLFSILLSFFEPIVVLKPIRQGPSRIRLCTPTEFCRTDWGICQKIPEGIVQHAEADNSKVVWPAVGLKGRRGSYWNPVLFRESCDLREGHSQPEASPRGMSFFFIPCPRAGLLGHRARGGKVEGASE